MLTGWLLVSRNAPQNTASPVHSLGSKEDGRTWCWAFRQRIVACRRSLARLRCPRVAEIGGHHVRAGWTWQTMHWLDGIERVNS